MVESTKDKAAVVVLPAIAPYGVENPDLRRWLSRGDIGTSSPRTEIVDRVTTALGVQSADSSRGALRLWGQTGERSAVWIAGADPVYLEARLDYLCLHRIAPHEVTFKELTGIFGALQEELGDSDAFGFIQLGHQGYLRASEPMPTATESPAQLDGGEPSASMPSGEDSRAYHLLHSEIQMALHLNADNRHREAGGQRPINALWIWGGGVAPEPGVLPLPPLFADEPTTRGHWYANTGSVFRWPVGIHECCEQAPDGFVAVLPDPLQPGDGQEMVSSCLKELRTQLANGGLREVVLIFQDGVTVRLRRRHVWRFWRGSRPEFDPGGSP